MIESIVKAAKEGDFKLLQEYLAERKNSVEELLLHKDDQGNTIFHSAAARQHPIFFELMDLTSQKKEVLLSRNDAGNTPLHLGCQVKFRSEEAGFVRRIFNHLTGKFAKSWLQELKLSPKELHEFKNSLLRARNKNNDTPFAMAFSSASSALLTTLMEFGDYIDNNPIGKLELERLQEELLQYPERRSLYIRRSERYREFPIPRAAFATDDALPYILVEFSQTFPQAWPLHYALLASGFSRKLIGDNYSCKYTGTVLNGMLERKDPSLHILSFEEANVSEYCDYSEHCLNGRFFNEQDRTALHFAVLNEKGHITKILLEKGAEFEMPDDNGATAYSLVMQGNSPFIKAQFLLAKAKKLHCLMIDLYYDLHLENQFDKEKFESSEVVQEFQAFLSKLSSFAKTLSEKELVIEDIQGILLSIGEFLIAPPDTQKYLKNHIERSRKDSIRLFKEDFSWTNPISPKLSYDILRKIPKSSKSYGHAQKFIYQFMITHFSSLIDTETEFEIEEEALEKKYKAELSDKNREKQLEGILQSLLYSKMKEEPYANYLGTYLFGNEVGMKGLSQFKDPFDPDSLMALFKTVRSHNQKMQQALNAKDQELSGKDKEIAALKAEIVALKAVQSHNLQSQKQRKQP